MSGLGWNTILEGWPWFKGTGQYPISAYSEFMPPPLLGRSPYGSADLLFSRRKIRGGGRSPNTRKASSCLRALR